MPRMVGARARLPGDACGAPPLAKAADARYRVGGMHRHGGLRRRLVAAIGLLAVLVLGVLAMLMATIDELRSADDLARRDAALVVPASRTHAAFAELLAVERRLRIAPRERRAAIAHALAHEIAAVRKQLADLEAGLGGAQPTAALDRAQADVRAYLDDVITPLLAAARRGSAGTPPIVPEMPGRGATVARALTEAVEDGRTSLLARRERASDLARRAELIGAGGIAAILLYLVAFAVYARRTVLQPLDHVVATARAMAAGDLTARVGDAPRGAGEMAELAETLDRMAASLEESQRALEARNAELARQRADLVDAVRSAREGASVLRAVLDATPDAIALLDGAGGVVVENPPMRAVRAAFGARATAIDPHGALVPLDAPANGELRDEITLVGTRRAFARYAAPVRDGHGTVVGHLLVLREVTGEREAERVKEEFFSLVSHELRTPLTSILGYVELVLAEEDEAIDPEHRHHLQIVERNAQRLLRLVGDLLFAAQVESGTLLLEPTAVDLPQVTAEALEAARPRAEDAGIALDGRIEPVPVTLGDRDRLAQVLDNLISNGLKFTPAGGRVEVRLRAEEGEAVLEVADTGVGIPAADRERIFDRFFRAANATARAVPGVGLGLMIVRAIVSAHGGTIDVDSEVGAGTTFHVRLPLRAARELDAELPVAYGDPPRGG